MRKNVQVCLLALFLCLTAALFAGCGDTPVQVEILINMDARFKGTRTITLNTGFAFEGKDDLKEKFDEVINTYCPSVLKKEVRDADDGLKYVFTLSFESKADYVNKLSAILDRQPSVALGTPDSALAKGWHLTEDFDGMELITWIDEGIAEKQYGGDLHFTYESTSNIVNMDGDIQSSSSGMIDINTVEGYPVTAVAIETTNHKKDNYDRRFTLSVPQSTYDQMGTELTALMQERTAPSAVYSGWTQQGNNQEFQVLYQGLAASELQSVTALFLDCDEASIYYGDEQGSSTPLAEQLVFEENLNTLSFLPKEDSEVSFSYKYSLPLRTTHGEGLVLYDGVWKKQGSWVDGIYTLHAEDKVYDIRIPDGIQYTIQGIAVTLEDNGGDNFVRYLDFLYSKQDGEEGRSYACDFFRKKGVDVSAVQNDDALICRVKTAGTAQQMNTVLGELFGGGNTVQRTENTSAMAVVTNIEFKDSINLSYMLTGDNAKAPFTYTLRNKGDENIVLFSGEGADVKDSATLTQDGSSTVELQGGENVISFTATVPYVQGVAVYCTIAGVMLLLAVLAIIFFIRKSRRLAAKEQLMQHREEPDEKKHLPQEHEDLRRSRTVFSQDEHDDDYLNL